MNLNRPIAYKGPIESSSLPNALESLGKSYLATFKGDDEEAALVRRQSLLVSALNELHWFLLASNDCDTTLARAMIHDLSDAMITAHKGLKPKLFQSYRTTGDRETAGRHSVKNCSLLAVSILVSCGMKEKDAQAHVARILLDSGHLARKRGSVITGKTIWEWGANANLNDRIWVRKHCELRLSELHGDLQQAMGAVGKLLRQPALLIKSG